MNFDPRKPIYDMDEFISAIIETNKEKEKMQKKTKKTIKKQQPAAEKKATVTKKIAVEEKQDVKLQPEPKKKAEPKTEAKGENNCTNCRWKKRVADTGKCPAIGKAVDLKKPVYNCERFRKNGGFFY